MEELLNPVQQETVEVVDIPGRKCIFLTPPGLFLPPGTM